MRQRHRVPLPRVFLALAIVGLLVERAGLPLRLPGDDAGRQGDGHGPGVHGCRRRSVGDLLQPGRHGVAGALRGADRRRQLLTAASADFEGADPFPGVGHVRGRCRSRSSSSRTCYVVAPLTTELNFGLGIFAPYGLGPALERPRHCSGRFISQNAVIQSADLNPVLSYKLFPELSIAAGADYRFSKVQLERNAGGDQPVHAVGRGRRARQAQQRPDVQRRLGLERRRSCASRSRSSASAPPTGSKIKVDYDGTATFTQRPTGNPVFDGLVAAQLPQGEHPVTTPIEFPASLNIGRRHRPRRRLPRRARSRLDGMVELQVPRTSCFPTARAATSTAPPPGRTPGPTASASRRSSATGRSASATTTTTRRSPRRTSVRSSPTTTATSTRRGFGYNTPTLGRRRRRRLHRVQGPRGPDGVAPTTSSASTRRQAWAAVADLRISF